MCVTQTGVLVLSLLGGGGNSSVYTKGLPAMLEGMGRLVCSTDEPNNAISAPKLADFLVHLFWVGVAWHTNDIYHCAISAFPEPHNVYKVSHHPVISELIHHFYLQCHPPHKHFDHLDVENLLSLLDSRAPASSLTNTTHTSLTKQ